MRRLVLAFLLAPALAGAQSPAAIDSIVERALKLLNNPGAAVAVVKDGKVIVARGYGIKKLGSPEKVGPDTRFGIASNTKAFTATAIGMLVEEGKLQWDAPVIRYLPDFAMYDPFVKREITIRDLLVHRSGLGLGAGDLLWWPASTYDRKEIMRRLRYIKPATSFRTAYAYDNVLYLVAGEVIERVSGMSWEQFVQTRILARVGMSNSTVRHSDAAGNADVATTHAELNGTLQVIGPMTSDNTNPAGGINAGARDIAKWLLVQLDSGKLADGSRLVTARTAREIWTGVTPIATGSVPPELAPLAKQFNLYALGFQTNDFRGKKLMWHTGGLPGYLSFVAFIPESRVGVAVLTNSESPMFTAAGWSLLDYALGSSPPWDFVGGWNTLRTRQQAAMAQQRERSVEVDRQPHAARVFLVGAVPRRLPEIERVVVGAHRDGALRPRRHRREQREQRDKRQRPAAARHRRGFGLRRRSWKSNEKSVSGSAARSFTWSMLPSGFSWNVT